MTETEIIKELRDQAAARTKGALNPFQARKQTIEWRAADELQKLVLVMESRDRRLLALSAMEATVVSTIGGMVEGHPTSTINYLQRLRELVAFEAEHPGTYETWKLGREKRAP